jgi:hypothetical protein
MYSQPFQELVDVLVPAGCRGNRRGGSGGADNEVVEDAE